MTRIFQCSLPDITCINCIIPVIENLNASGKVKSVKPDVRAKTITIIIQDHLDANDQDTIIKLLRDEIEDVGAACDAFTEINLDDVTIDMPVPAEPKPSRRKLYAHIVQGAIGTTVGAVLMGIAFSGMDIPMTAMYWLVGSSSLLTLGLGATSYRDAVVNLVKKRKLTMDVLYTVSTLTIVGTSVASFFVPWLPMTMEAGVLIFGFKHFGKAIEEAINHKIAVGLSLQERAARSVLVLQFDENWIEWPSEGIQVDDFIRLQAGQTLPVNGVLELEDDKQEVWLYKTIDNGSMLPERGKQGELLPAGIRVPPAAENYHTPYIQVRVTQTLANSSLAKRERQNAAIVHEEADIEVTANNILRFFIPAVFGASAVAGIVVGFVYNPALAIQCATSVLVSACPCVFGFITPSGIKFGMMKAESLGVIFKTSHAIHEADKIKKIIFDLNGTLTVGLPEVSDHVITNLRAISAEEFFSVVTAIEEEVTHPIAKIIREYAVSKCRNKVELIFDELDTTNHAGVSAVINGNHYLIGSEQLMQHYHVPVKRESNFQITEQIVYVAKNHEMAGYFVIEDKLRDDALFTINELKAMGIEVHLCTGADEGTALRYAQKLGIAPQHVFAGCNSSSDDPAVRKKIDYVKLLQAQNAKVAMFGDGGNDALALKESDLGVAMNSTALDNMTNQNASAVIQNGSMLPALTMFAVARQTIRSVKQNIGLSLIYNMIIVLVAGGILLGAGLNMKPAIGVGLMVLQMALITLNQYRTYKWTPLSYVKRYNEMQGAREMEVVTSYDLMRQNGLVMAGSRNNHSIQEEGMVPVETTPLMQATKLDQTSKLQVRHPGF